ncbi:hypothetical protein C8D79_0656 [Bacteriovorax stolpii]|nr:hypothetical protein [Bacteriovorax stolpii]TDP55601.1 hypothetical protein C8D79_0656 [Bacteriovorax stolpii]
MLEQFLKKLLDGNCKFYSFKEQMDFELEQELRRERNLSCAFTIF